MGANHWHVLLLIVKCCRCMVRKAWMLRAYNAEKPSLPPPGGPTGWSLDMLLAAHVCSLL
jgi:hypothetical protein